MSEIQPTSRIPRKTEPEQVTSCFAKPPTIMRVAQIGYGFDSRRLHQNRLYVRRETRRLCGSLCGLPHPHPAQARRGVL